MNIPLPRLIEGIIATLRSEVIPHVQDPYARGQAVGVIDLLNNIEPRIEWATAPLQAQVEAKRDLLREITPLVPNDITSPAQRNCRTAEDYLVTQADLDARIGDALVALWPSRSANPAAQAAVAKIQALLHDEASAAMKTTRKPSFAEIASGGEQARKA